MNERLDIRKIRAQQPVTVAKENAKPENEADFWDFLNREITFGIGGLSDKIRESFYLELWTLLEAGIDIRSGLQLIKDEQKNKKARTVFANVLDLVVNGSTLSEAMIKSRQFSSFEFFSIQIGEETGKLVRVLKELSVFFQRRIKQRQQIIGAITYPAVVLTVAFVAVSFMLTYVVPMFSDIFKRFGNDLPGITKMVIALSAILKKTIWKILVLLILIAMFFFWQRKKLWVRKFSSTFLLNIPVIGGILKEIYLGRFANTMALLAGSRIPIVQAIQLTQKMITFYPIENSLKLIEEKVIRGEALHKSLSEFSIYPAKMVSMIRVGEEVNQLELFFARIGEQYANEVEYRAGMLNKFLEPVIIVLLGLVVGVVLIAMYLPLFKLGQSF